MENTLLDRDWFKERLDRIGKSQNAMARHLGRNPSAMSKMMSGERKMKLSEAERIARFIQEPIEEVLKHAGVKLTTARPGRINFDYTISEAGNVEPAEPRALRLSVVARAESMISGDTPVIAAQVRAMKGALAIWDDALVLFAAADTVEPAAVGVLSIVRLREGITMIGHVDALRKTGEATLTTADGQTKQVTLEAATPVLAVVP